MRHVSGDKNDPWSYRRVLAVLAAVSLAAGLGLKFWPSMQAWFV
jgi:hypothetical protein